jgi:hypothetical protein
MNYSCYLQKGGLNDTSLVEEFFLHVFFNSCYSIQ